MDKITKGYPNWDIPLNNNIQEYNDTIGTEEMGTASTTIKGAIKELKNSIDTNKTDLSDKVQINTADISNLKTKNTEITTQLNDIKNDISQLSNPNLLINGDFQVWQRGETINGIGVKTYVCDRWTIVSTTEQALINVSKVSNGMKIVQNNTGGYFLSYKIDEELLSKIRGKVVTLSYSRNNEIVTKTFTIPSNATAPYLLIDEGRTGNPNGDIYNWFKLELGSIATPFIPRPYAEELALCQRYYERSTHVTRGLIGAELTRLSFDVQYKQTKRIVPTLKIYGFNNEEGVVVGKIGSPINFPIQVYSNNTDGFGGIDIIDKKGQSFVTGETFEIYGWEASAEIY